MAGRVKTRQRPPSGAANGHGVAIGDCPCGSLLPHHLAAVGLTEHVCRCERAYRVEAGVFVHVGHEANPFARTR